MSGDETTLPAIVVLSKHVQRRYALERLGERPPASATYSSSASGTSHIHDVLGLAPSDDDHRRVLAVIQYLSR